MPDDQQPPTNVMQPVEVPADVAELTPKIIDPLKERLQQAREKHNQWIDKYLFNFSTALVLLFTASASFIPSFGDSTPKWIAPLLAGLAGLLVAMERALGFGARWRYHREMYYAYDSILDMLDFYPIFPLSKKAKYVSDIFTALSAVRSRESAIPNAGTNSAST